MQTLVCLSLCSKMDVTKVEQRSYVKIAFLRGRNARECHTELREALGDRALPYRTVARWMEAFKRGRAATVDLPRSGRPESAHTVVQVAVIENCLRDERRWTVAELAAHTGISESTVFRILRNDLKMRKLCAKWVPHALTEVQKWTRYETCRINLERFHREGNEMLNRIVTIDETWARAYEPELKRQSNEWRHRGSPRKHKFRQNPSPTKVMLILAYDSQGILECHPVRQGHTVNAAYYRSFLLHNLRRTLRRKRPELLNNVIILHDNATSHTAACVQNLVRRWGWEILEHPPYSPDLSPCDFDLIPKLKTPLRGKRFANREDILTAFRREVAHIDASRTADGIQRLPHRWERCMEALGDYFEGC